MSTDVVVRIPNTSTQVRRGRVCIFISNNKTTNYEIIRYIQVKRFRIIVHVGHTNLGV
jgi:hypothetical protein